MTEYETEVESAPEPDAASQSQDERPAGIPEVSGAPTKRLPTPRIAFQRQLDLLRAYAASSPSGQTPATNEDVSGIVGLTKDTISLANAFFADVGFLTRSEGGYVPSEEVRAFARVHPWKGDEAATELAPKLRDAWFGRALLPRLSYSPMSEADALAELAKAAHAGPNYRPQLETVLDYLAAARLVRREGGLVHGVSHGTPTPESKPEQPPAAPAAAPPTRQAAPTGGLPLLIQGLLQQLPTEGDWSRDEADAWLELAEKVFQVVYKLPPPEKKVREQ